MIIWVNGAFGSGKTQTAYELHRRLPGSFVYDPENVGYFIRKNIPQQTKKDDFQDYPMWREFNYSMLSYIAREHHGVVIVPMTIVQPQYFHEVIGRLREDGVEIHHFALCASKETLLRRLRKRGEGKHSWAAQQIDRCINGLSDELFGHHLHTDQMTIEEVAEQIAAKTNLTLLRGHKNSLLRRINRWITQIRHIR